jgi:hypothetical protein
MNIVTFSLGRLGVTPPPVDGVVGWRVGVGATPPPPVDVVVGCCSRKLRVAVDFILAEFAEVSWILGLSPLRGPSCQTWFTVVPLPSVSVANIVISLFSKVADRFETAKLKAPSVNVLP